MRRLSLFKKTPHVTQEDGDVQEVGYPLDSASTTQDCQPGTPAEEEENPPPDGGVTAWTCCLAVFLINGFTWGVAAVRISPSFPEIKSFTLHRMYIRTKMPPNRQPPPSPTASTSPHYLSTSHFPTATPTDYAFLGGLTFGSALFFSPLITIATRKLGQKPIMFSGSILMSSGFIAASFARAPEHLYFTQGALVGLDIGALFIPSVQVVPQWFDRRRSLAVGVASSGCGFGGLAFSFATDALIRNVSPAWALRVTKLCVSWATRWG